jgi:acetyl-CoA acetyltransferase family protein
MESMDLEPEEIDSVVCGCVGATADAPNVGRQAALEAGIPADRPGYTVNQACASGFRAVTDMAGQLRGGEAEVGLAAGCESMSSYPFLFEEGLKNAVAGVAFGKTILDKVKAVTKVRPRDFQPVIALKEGLMDTFAGLSMGETADAMAKIWDLSRVEQDRLATESHRRTAEAWAAGRYEDEVVTACPPPRFDKVVTQDIGFRPRQSLEALAKLKPAFDRRAGTVTAGNSCMLTDGAAACILMTESQAKERGLEPYAYLRGWSYIGLEPGEQGLMGPAYAIPKLLGKYSLKLGDIDLFEINEAFATVVLCTQRALVSESWCQENLGQEAVGELALERVNVNGGALALGHPLGATGTRLVGHLAREMKRRGVARGIASLCVHGGLGAALLLEGA